MVRMTSFLFKISYITPNQAWKCKTDQFGSTHSCVNDVNDNGENLTLGQRKQLKSVKETKYERIWFIRTEIKPK